MDDYNNVISSALVNSEPPDIFTTNSWMIGNESYDALFESCEDLSDPSVGIDYSCIKEPLIRTTDTGEVVMLPIFTTSYGMLVNMDIFEKEGLKVPTGFDELKQVSAGLKAAGYESPVMGTDRFYAAPSGDDGGYFINSVSICFSVNKNSRNIDMANEFMRFLISRKELGNMSALKRLITPADDFSDDEIYSPLADIPDDRSFSDKETGLLDPAVRQFRAAVYAVGNGEMTVDEAVAAYGSIPEE